MRIHKLRTTGAWTNAWCTGRFWKQWANLHLVDSETAPAPGGPVCEIQPLLDILTDMKGKGKGPHAEEAS